MGHCVHVGTAIEGGGDVSEELRAKAQRLVRTYGVEQYSHQVAQAYLDKCVEFDEAVKVLREMIEAYDVNYESRLDAACENARDFLVKKVSE